MMFFFTVAEINCLAARIFFDLVRPLSLFVVSSRLTALFALFPA